MDDCALAKELVSFTIYPHVLIGKICVFFAGIIFTAYGTKKQGLAWLVHPNAKAIFITHSTWIILVNVCYLVTYVYEVYRIFKHVDSDCDYLIAQKVSFWIRFPAATGCCGQSFTMLAFAVERMISTYAPRWYEKTTKPYVGIILGLLSSIAAVTASYFLLGFPNSFDGMAIAASTLTPQNALTHFIWFAVIIASDALAVIIFICCLFVSRCIQNKFKRTSGLSIQYQMRENQSVILLLLPCFFAHIVINLLPTAAFTVLNSVFHYSSLQRILGVELLNQIGAYSLVMPMAFWFRKQKKQRERRTRISFRGTPSTDEYFHQLAEQWK